MDANPATLKIETLEEAREIFFKVAAGTDTEVNFDGIEFGEYFHLEFHLPSYSSEMPRQFIQSYHSNYKRLYQLVALIENGRADIKTLTKEQQKRYEFSVRVTEGSSNLEDNGSEILAGALREAFKKMSSRQAVLVILGSVLLGCTAWGAVTYIEAQKDVRLAEITSQEREATIQSITAAQATDVATMREIVSIMQASGEVGRSAVAAVNDIQDGRLRAMSETDVTEIGGVTITQEQAKELRSTARKRSIEVTVKQEMRVVDVNTSDDANIVVTLEDPETGEQTKLSYSERLNGTLWNAQVFEALQNRTMILVSLRGKMLDDQLNFTEITGVEPVPAPI